MIALAGIFIAAVILLTLFGKEFMHRLELGNSTQIYLDLAHAAYLDKQYIAAEHYYKEAVAIAERNEAQGAPVCYAMLTYADFLRKRKRLNDARALESRAHRLMPGAIQSVGAR